MRVIQSGGPGGVRMSSTASAPTVAVLGTGVMGTGMAGSLLRAGFGVRVWNRTREKAEPLAARGASVFGAAAEAVRGADVVLVMVFDADAVVEVMSGAAEASGPRTVWCRPRRSAWRGPRGWRRWRPS